MTALDAVLADLACPHCAGALHRADGGLGCAVGHRFDVARQGYAALLTGRRGPTPGDDAAMVAAREGVLAAGHYEPLTRAVATASRTALAVRPDGLVVDVGAGTGQHLAAVVDPWSQARGLALDVSAPALRRAARRHPRVAAAAADVWAGLPVRDGAASVVLDVFSPRNADEFARILSPTGVLVVAVPLATHLAELVAAVGLIAVDPDKDRRLTDQLGDRFQRVHADDLTWPLALAATDAADLVAMTPSARHVDAGAVAARLSDLAGPDGTVEVTAAVRVEVHRRRRAAAP